uniref:Putative udp-glucose:glycoprotein glucosyltransferase n=1 Tax=Ixodes ricinus TaxID=34613 RepID=A0A0K8R8W5_IXORI
MQETFVVLAALSLVLGVQCAPQKVISVTLDSKWSSTPLHLEASEFFAEESNDYFWRFVSDFQNVDLATFSNSTPKAQYETVLEVASKHLSPARLALLKLSLSLRSHSPAVETFQQVRCKTPWPVYRCMTNANYIPASENRSKQIAFDGRSVWQKFNNMKFRVVNIKMTF